jgi:photosystem II stability/assembly factor-like uncharacterized protein
VEGVPGADPIKFVHFSSQEEGWMVTDYSVHLTRDAGQTWASVLSYPDVRQRNMQMLGLEDRRVEMPLER